MPSIPRASIIIPNLNSPILGEVIESVLNQQSSDEIELIVVGMDKYNFSEQFPIVKFFPTPHPVSPAVARNIGISKAVADILVFLDADCVANKTWLSTILGDFDNPNIFVLGGGVAFRKDNFFTLCDNVSTFHEYMTSSPKSKKEQLPSLNLALRRDVINQAGVFNEKYPYPAGEDAELTTRIRLQGFDLFFDPEAYIFHQPQRTSIFDLSKHAYRLGQFSIKLNPSYKKNFKNATVLSHSLLVILLSPLLSLAIILKLLFVEKLPLEYWPTIPFVFLLKIIWCFGASSTLRRGKPIENWGS